MLLLSRHWQRRAPYVHHYWIVTVLQNQNVLVSMLWVRVWKKRPTTCLGVETFNRLKTAPETYRYTLKRFIIQDKRTTNTRQRSINDTIQHKANYNYILDIKNSAILMINSPSLDSSIYPSLPSILLHPSLSISPSIHQNSLVIVNPRIIKDTQ